MALYIGVDIGTSGTKSLIMNEQGEILAESSTEYPVHMPKPLWTEQDPEDWWQAVKKTIKAVVKTSKAKKSDVKAIGLSGQMHGSVFLNRQGKVIRPALLWNDQRTAAECDEITKRAGGREALIGMVANPALTGFTAPKLLWLRNHEPKNYAALAHLLLPKDDVRRRLTGEFATDASDASGMLLLDVKNRTWSKELLSKLEIDPSILATVYESEQVTGTLLPEVAAELGLSTECKVVGGIVGVNTEVAQLIHAVEVLRLAVELVYRLEAAAVGWHLNAVLADKYREVLVAALVHEVAIEASILDKVLKLGLTLLLRRPGGHPAKPLGVFGDIVQIFQLDDVAHTADASLWRHALSVVHIEEQAILDVVFGLRTFTLGTLEARAVELAAQ